MKNFKKAAGLVGVLVLTASPALAAPGQVPANAGKAPANAGTAPAPQSSQGVAHKPATPGPDASSKTKKKAYGKLCADQSRKHVAGTSGTPFSKCVTAMAKVARDDVNPTTACKTLSKKPVAGTSGTPFSKCVSAAAKLQQDADAAAAA